MGNKRLRRLAASALFLAVSAGVAGVAHAAPPTTVPSTARALVALPANWQELPLTEFRKVCVEVARVESSPARNEAQAKLAQVAWSKYLGSTELVAKLDSESLAQLAGVCGNGLSADQKKFLREAIGSRFKADANTWANVPAGIFASNFLREGRTSLDMPVDDAAVYLWAYVGSAETWKTADPQDLDALLSVAHSLGKKSSRSFEVYQSAQKVSHWTFGTYLAKPESLAKLSSVSLVHLAAATAPDLSPAEREPLRAYLISYFDHFSGKWSELTWWEMGSMLRWGLTEQLNLPKDSVAAWTAAWANSTGAWRERPDLEWGQLVDLLHDAKLPPGAATQRTELFNQISAATVARVSEGKPFKRNDWVYSNLGLTLGEKDQEALRQGIVSKGMVLQDSARLLAWSYQGGGKLPEWQTTAETKAKDTHLSPDERAGWMLARGYAAQMAGGQKNIDALAGRKWAEQGLATARSEATRLQCVEFLVDMFLRQGASAQASSLITGVGANFSEPASVTALAALKSRVAEAQSDAKESAATARHSSQLAWIAEIQKRRQAAVAAGRTDLVTQLDQMLQAHPAER